MSFPKPSGIVTLTTDFGTASSYAASLRGALLSVSREIVLADVSHDVPPFDVMSGALLLFAAAPAFPPGTVHLAVVDPGVGGPRRPIIGLASDHYFVGPDNGLFTPFLKQDARVWEIDPSRAAPGRLSATFHGRDIFAPAAARLARGESPEALGSRAGEAALLAWPEPRVTPAGIEGVIWHVDAFGNAMSNIPEALIPMDPPPAVEIAGHRIAPIRRTYADQAAGSVLALIGSSGFLEVAVTRGSAAEQLGVGVGTAIRLMPGGDPPG